SLFCINDTSAAVIYTLSLHDALPICLFMPLSTKEISVTEATAGGENRLLWMSATRGVTPAITGRILNGWNMRVRRIQPGGRPYPRKIGPTGCQRAEQSPRCKRRGFGPRRRRFAPSGMQCGQPAGRNGNMGE